MRITYLILLCVILSTAAKAQKMQLLQTTEEVVEAAIAEIDRSMQNGVFKEFAEKHNIKGIYIFDITVHKKGEVASVFAASSDGADIPTQNKLKDFVKDYRFNFKMAKGNRYKFQYIFEFE